MTHSLTVSFNNSTIIPLAANATFVGVKDILKDFPEVDITVFRTPTDAPATLYFEFSPEGIHWDVSVPLPLIGSNGVPITLRSVLPFFRIRYINGNIDLSELRITTVLHCRTGMRLTRFLSQEVDNNEPVEVVRIAKSILPEGAASESTLSSVNTKLSETLKVDQIINTTKTLYDIQETVAYIGTAPQGSASSAAVWTIKKTSFDVSGNPTVQVTSGPTAIWDNRASESYS